MMNHMLDMDLNAPIESHEKRSNQACWPIGKAGQNLAQWRFIKTHKGFSHCMGTAYTFDWININEHSSKDNLYILRICTICRYIPHDYTHKEHISSFFP